MPITIENKICNGRLCVLLPNRQLNFKDDLAAQPTSIPLNVSKQITTI